MLLENGVERPGSATRAILTRVAAGDITQAQAMTLARKKVREAQGEKTMSKDEYKMKTDLRNQKTFGEGRTLDKKHGGKAHKKMKHGGKAHKKMKHGGKAHKEDMMYGGGAGMTKKKKKGMMGGGKMYASMNNRYAHGGKVYPSKGKI